MRTTWQRIRSGWTTTDTWVSLATIGALALYIADGWWHSVGVCYVGSLAPLALLGWRAVRDRTLARALAFGGLVAWLWPLVEGSYVRALGWWGSYLQPGIKVWDTPVYCILVGWLTASYVAYSSARIVEIGFARRTSAIVTGFTALVLSVAGENLLVRAGMWTYTHWEWSFGYVPAYIPFGYGLTYFAVPALERMHVTRAAVAFTALTLVLFFGIGYAATFVR